MTTRTLPGRARANHVVVLVNFIVYYSKLWQAPLTPAALSKWLTVVAASTIASCVSELLHVTSKSSNEEKETFLARVKCPSRDLPLVLTDKCKISIMIVVIQSSP